MKKESKGPIISQEAYRRAFMTAVAQTRKNKDDSCPEIEWEVSALKEEYAQEILSLSDRVEKLDNRQAEVDFAFLLERSSGIKTIVRIDKEDNLGNNDLIKQLRFSASYTQGQEQRQRLQRDRSRGIDMQ